MRGSGKSFIGSLAASVLDWPSIDADAYFEDKHKIGVREFVHQHGWPAFRSSETEILQELLTNHATHHIISLGGGIVETPVARAILKKHAERGQVVYIKRQIEEVLTYLGEENARPAYDEPITEVFGRREPWFEECSSYEFVNHTGVLASSEPDPSKARKAIHDEVSRFFKHITGKKANLAPNLTPGKRSYFLSLTYSDILLALPYIEDLTTGVDAIELRVDLLRSPKDFDTFATYIPQAAYISDQIAVLRRTTTLPIIFTVRTVSQGGLFPDNAEHEALELLTLALRLGVEYIDVEISWSEKMIRQLLRRKGSSHIIASWHDWSGHMDWSSNVVKEKYSQAARLGDIVKIVGMAKVVQDNFSLVTFVSWVNSSPQAKPIVAINMGTAGQLSRVLNTSFTPVSHPLLPTKAAPGQLSFPQIQQALHLIGQLPDRRFFLFGNPISQSMSPALHNTGFHILGLPHTYELLETTDVGEEIKATIASPHFGGASVTIPFKVDVIPLLDKLSPAARAIGAVNTIIPRAAGADASSRLLYGDNTDWLAIRDCIQSNLSSSGGVGAALVIGAGGTARAAIYALYILGAHVVLLYNRTQSKAEALADAFPDVKIEVIDNLDSFDNHGQLLNVIISTVPASATTTDDTTAVGDAVYLPGSLFNGDHAAEEGVVVDMAYRPAETPLLALAKISGIRPWATVPGMEILLAQGYAQFELWTERKCPREAVGKQVWAIYSAHS
jgi:pentafunctional AROM polypeptide